MTKTKRSRLPRGGGARKLRPTAQPRYPLREHQRPRADRRYETLAVRFEGLGECYDDVLVGLKATSAGWPRSERHRRGSGVGTRRQRCTASTPGYAEQLAAPLWRLGYTVRGEW